MPTFYKHSILSGLIDTKTEAETETESISISVSMVETACQAQMSRFHSKLEVKPFIFNLNQSN
jgi:hypothetical protein